MTARFGAAGIHASSSSGGWANGVRTFRRSGHPGHFARVMGQRHEDAVTHGVFGSPSFLVGDELFFGKDRLRDVEEEIAALA